MGDKYKFPINWEKVSSWASIKKKKKVTENAQQYHLLRKWKILAAAYLIM